MSSACSFSEPLSLSGFTFQFCYRGLSAALFSRSVDLLVDGATWLRSVTEHQAWAEIYCLIDDAEHAEQVRRRRAR